MKTTQLLRIALAAISLVFSTTVFAVAGNVNLGAGQANQSFTVTLPDGNTEQAESDKRGIILFDFDQDGDYTFSRDGNEVQKVVVSGGVIVSGAVIPATAWNSGNIFTGHSISAGWGEFDANDKEPGGEWILEYRNYDLFSRWGGNAQGVFGFLRYGDAEPDPARNSLATNVNATSIDAGVGWEWLIRNLFNNEEAYQKWRASWGVQGYLNYTDMDADFVVPVLRQAPYPDMPSNTNPNTSSNPSSNTTANVTSNNTSSNNINNVVTPTSVDVIEFNEDENSFGVGAGVFLSLHNLNSPWGVTLGIDSTYLFDDVLGNDNTLRYHFSVGYRF